MNHIKRLQLDLKEAHENVGRALGQITDFEAYLQGPKFQGPCNDHIRNHEVEALLRRITLTLCGFKEGEL